MMAFDSARFVVRRCSDYLALVLIAAAMSWVSPGYADESDVPFDLNSVPFHFTPTADQDNFRGGTLTWEPDPIVSRRVNFTLKVCFTRSDFPGRVGGDGFPCPGDIVFNTTGTKLFFGDGLRFDQRTDALFFLVTSIDPASDVMCTVALCPGDTAETTIRHTYTACNRGNGSNIDRQAHIGPVPNRSQDQENNSAKGWRLNAWVTPCTGNRSPVVTLPPQALIRLPANQQLNEFSFPVSEPEPGTHYEWSFVQGNEAGGGFVRKPIWITWANPINPGSPVSSLDGVLRANTTDLLDRTNWSIQVKCQEFDGDQRHSGETLLSSTPVDFIVQIVDCTINSIGPSFNATATVGCNPAVPTPACGSTVMGFTVGEEKCFPVQASDLDVHDTPYGYAEPDQLLLTASNLPPGATFEPSIGNPVSGELCWTPTCDQAGKTHVVTFTVDDVCHGPTTCDVTLAVGSNGCPDCSMAQATVPTLPNDHQYHPVSISGVTDPDGDPVTVCVTGVTSDEPVAGAATGDLCPDATISSCSTSLAGESDPGGNGRVYIVSFTATDGKGGSCDGTVTVCVPSCTPAPCVDDRGVGSVSLAGYDATSCRVATTDLHTLPTNHVLFTVSISGVPHLCVSGVTSDETVAGGDCPDAILNPCPTSSVQLRGERDPGSNGRVYIVTWTSADLTIGSCSPVKVTEYSGSVKVTVPPPGLESTDDRCVGSVPPGGYDATDATQCTVPAVPESQGQVVTRFGLNAVRVNGGLTTVEYSLPAEGDVKIAVFDIAGRRMGTLVNSRQTAGSHQASWNSSGLSRGIYYYRMQAAGRTLTRSIYMK